MRTTVVGDGMARQFTIVCDDDQVRMVETLARRYGITEEEVLSQLVELGLEARDELTAYAGFFRDSELPQMGQRSRFSSNSRPQPAHWNSHSRCSEIPSRAITSTATSSFSATFCIA